MPDYIEIKIPESNQPLFDDVPPQVIRIPRTFERQHRLRVAASYQPEQTAAKIINLFAQVCNPNPTAEDFDNFLVGIIQTGVRLDRQRRTQECVAAEDVQQLRANVIPWSGSKRRSS